MVAKYERDMSKSIEAQYAELEAHHIAETTELIEKTSELVGKASELVEKLNKTRAEVEGLKLQLQHAVAEERAIVAARMRRAVEKAAKAESFDEVWAILEKGIGVPNLDLGRFAG